MKVTCPHCRKSFDTSAEWSKVDWSLTTTVIARQMGRTKSTVSGARKRYSPETVHQDKVNWECVNWAKPTNTLAKELGVHRCAVSAMRRKYAPGTVGKIFKHGRNKHDWELVDWSSPVKEIAAKLGISYQAAWQQKKKRK